MKITSDKESLINGIQVIQPAITSKAGGLPVLQNFLIETDESGLKLVSTDLEMAIKHFMKVDIKNDGSVTIPMKKFVDVVQNLDKEEINIFVDEASRIAINSGKTKVRIGGLPKSDYPLIPDIDEKDSFRMKAFDAMEMIEKTVFSSALDDERHFLNGLLWKNEKDVFSIVATDGRRLAVAWKEGLKIKKDFKVIIPTKVMNELVKFIKTNIKDEKEEMTVGLSTNQVGFKFGKTLFISRLIEGNFPAYEQIIPKTIESSVSVVAEKLLAVTRRAAICSSDRSGLVRYTFKKNILIVNASSQIMDFEDELDVEFSGKDFQINYNPKFIIDILKNIGSREVVFEFTGPTTPSVVKSPENKNLLYVVMPLRA